MPNLSSAKKALRQAEKLRARNRRRKRVHHIAIKKAMRAVESGAKEEALKYAHEAQKALDKAAKAGTIKANTAARRLSRLMKKINEIN